MQQTIQTYRTAQRAFSLKEWTSAMRNSIHRRLNARNDFFSDLHGEEFTNRHVLLVHLFVTALIAVCGLAEWLEGGAL